MNAKTKKLALIGAAAVVLCAGIFMALQAFNENLVFFFSPTQVAAKEAPVGRTFRLGGVVEKNSCRGEKRTHGNGKRLCAPCATRVAFFATEKVV